MEYTTAKEPEKITPKIWTKWEWRGCVRPVFDIAGCETWAVLYRCPRCGFTSTFIEDHGHYVFCPDCGEQNMGVTAWQNVNGYHAARDCQKIFNEF